MHPIHLLSLHRASVVIVSFVALYHNYTCLFAFPMHFHGPFMQFLIPAPFESVQHTIWFSALVPLDSRGPRCSAFLFVCFFSLTLHVPTHRLPSLILQYVLSTTPQPLLLFILIGSILPHHNHQQMNESNKVRQYHYYIPTVGLFSPV